MSYSLIDIDIIIFSISVIFIDIDIIIIIKVMSNYVRLCPLQLYYFQIHS